MLLIAFPLTYLTESETSQQTSRFLHSCHILWPWKSPAVELHTSAGHWQCWWQEKKRPVMTFERAWRIISRTHTEEQGGLLTSYATRHQEKVLNWWHTTPHRTDNVCHYVTQVQTHLQYNLSWGQGTKHQDSSFNTGRQLTGCRSTPARTCVGRWASRWAVRCPPQVSSWYQLSGGTLSSLYHYLGSAAKQTMVWTTV